MTLDWIVIVVLVAAIFAAGVRKVRSPVAQIIAGVVVAVALGIDVPPELSKYVVPVMGSMLVFLAGSEVDAQMLSQRWRAGLVLAASTVLTAGGAALLITSLAAGWSADAAALAAIGFGAPSVSLVYVLLVRAHLTGTSRAALLMVPTLFAALAVMALLAVLFVEFERPLLVFAAASAVVLVGLPRAVRLAARYTHGAAAEWVRELIVMGVLGTLAVLGREAHADAAVVALLVGLRMRSCELDGRDCKRVRRLSLPAITSIFFVIGGMTIPLVNVLGFVPLVLGLACAKLLAFDGSLRLVGRAVRWEGRETDGLAMAAGTTLLVLSANFGVGAGVIDTDQYGVMVVSAVTAAVIGGSIAEMRMHRFRAVAEQLAPPAPEPAPEPVPAQVLSAK